MTYAVLGYAMIALIVILLLTNKANPIMAFIIVPPIIALTAGYSISEINDFIKAGVSSSMGTALLAMLSIIFFRNRDYLTQWLIFSFPKRETRWQLLL